MSESLNIASRLTVMAKRFPDTLAVAEPLKSGGTAGPKRYRTITFAELDADSDRIAAAMIESGVEPGMRIALFVRYGIDFVSLVYSLCKAGATLVLIDPGMGIRRMLDCLAEVAPDGFVAIPPVHAVRCLMQRRFSRAKHLVTVGRRWFWGGLTLDGIRKRPKSIDFKPADTAPGDLAAIIFTSGSTGPPKGVAFTHRIFDTQVEEISKRYDILPGEIDLACFPFFGLFDAAMGVTAIIPDMDPTKPAKADPAKIVEAAKRWKITQSFASPALWKRVSDYCIENDMKLETLRRAVSAGAPVSATILGRLQRCIAPDGDIFTPYGATEALPTASISASEVLGETVAKTNLGGGVCVGTRFPTIDWKVIGITDSPIEKLEDAEKMPLGEIGELAVTGPQVTTMYVNRPEANAAAKMTDAEGRIWHRMGDVGYLDERDRFWFCGRKAHCVETPEGTLFSIRCEAIFNRHPSVFRSALASSPDGPRIFVEPFPERFPKTKNEERQLIAELLELGRNNPVTEAIHDIRVMKSFPVDVRHNVKIDRELLSAVK